jgi:peptide/nickel transport system permease protein
VLAAPAALTILVLGWGAGLALALAESAPGERGPRRRLGVDTGRCLAAVAAVAQVLPIFWLGGLLVAAMSVGAGWLPPGGIADPTGPAFGTAAYRDALGGQPLTILGDLCRHLILPACTLALAGMATAPRLLRAVLPALVEAPHQRAARGAGLCGRRLAWRAVRPALATLLGAAAADAPLLASALVLVEYLYGWPGLGLLAYQATRAGDTRTMGAMLLLFGLTVTALSLLADLLAALADPRLREASG